MEPVREAENAFMRTAIARLPQREQDLRDAYTFLKFKRTAAGNAQLILEQLMQESVSSADIVQQLSSEGQVSVELHGIEYDHTRASAVHAFFDLFLFETTSVGDALAQLVNAAFALDVPVRDVRIADIDARLKRQARGHQIFQAEIGLGAWVSPPRTSWLGWVIECRNIVTHRHLIDEVVGPMAIHMLGSESPTSGRVGNSYLIANASGTPEDLSTFLTNTTEQLKDLLASSLQALTELLIRVPPARS